MRTLARSTISVLLLCCGCGGDDSGGDGGPGSSADPTTSPGTDPSGDSTEAPPTTTDPAPDTTTTDPSATGPEPTDGSDDDSGSTTASGGEPGDWLLTVDAGTSPSRLMRVDLTGGATEVCTLPATVEYVSFAFTADGTLYGFNAAAARIDAINPCNCSFQLVGPTSLASLALERRGAQADELLGIDHTLDALVRVDLATGLATVIGPLGFFFGPADLAWSDALGAPYAIEGDNDYLYTIDPATGAATPGMPLSEDLTDPGLAVHPNDGLLYACHGDMLSTIEAATGLMSPVGALGLTGPCHTLVAPQTAIACIDAL